MDAIELYWYRYEWELKRHQAAIRRLNHEIGRLLREQDHDVSIGQTYFSFGHSPADSDGASGDRGSRLDVWA